MSPKIICVKEINKECRCPLCEKEWEEKLPSWAEELDVGAARKWYGYKDLTEMYRGIK